MLMERTVFSVSGVRFHYKNPLFQIGKPGPHLVVVD